MLVFEIQNGGMIQYDKLKWKVDGYFMKICIEIFELAEFKYALRISKLNMANRKKLKWEYILTTSSLIISRFGKKREW